MKYYISCRSCDKRISNLLDKHIVLADFRSPTDVSLLASGQYCTDPDGDLCIAIADKHELRYHPDDRRMTGCCGPSNEGLPNLICSCKAEIGREISDCNTPHFIRLFQSRVNIKTDHNGALEAILHSSVSDEEKASLELLLRYGQ